MINIENNIDEIYVSSTKIVEAYIGSQLVWEKNSPMPFYDAEIEYLESTGTQWIDTGVYHNEGQSYAIDIIATPTKVESDFIATRIGNGGMVVGFYNYFVFGYNRPNSRIDTERLEVKKTELHIEYEFKDGNRTLMVNGISYSKEGATYSANSTIRIYGGYQGVYYSSIKCKRVIFRDANNNLLIDMIPVRVGQVGYMYDKVSKQLFGNAGTGDFVLGPDVT